MKFLTENLRRNCKNFCEKGHCFPHGKHREGVFTGKYRSVSPGGKYWGGVYVGEYSVEEKEVDLQELEKRNKTYILASFLTFIYILILEINLIRHTHCYAFHGYMKIVPSQEEMEREKKRKEEEERRKKQEEEERRQ